MIHPVYYDILELISCQIWGIKLKYSEYIPGASTNCLNANFLEYDSKQTLFNHTNNKKNAESSLFN